LLLVQGEDRLLEFGGAAVIVETAAGRARRTGVLGDCGIGHLHAADVVEARTERGLVPAQRRVDDPRVYEGDPRVAVVVQSPTAGARLVADQSAVVQVELRERPDEDATAIAGRRISVEGRLVDHRSAVLDVEAAAVIRRLVRDEGRSL
jgi:hypothetical protein